MSGAGGIIFSDWNSTWYINFPLKPLPDGKVSYSGNGTTPNKATTTVVTKSIEIETSNNNLLVINFLDFL